MAVKRVIISNSQYLSFKLLLTSIQQINKVGMSQKHQYHWELSANFLPQTFGQFLSIQCLVLDFQ